MKPTPEVFHWMIGMIEEQGYSVRENPNIVTQELQLDVLTTLVRLSGSHRDEPTLHARSQKEWPCNMVNGHVHYSIVSSLVATVSLGYSSSDRRNRRDVYMCDILVHLDEKTARDIAGGQKVAANTWFGWLKFLGLSHGMSGENRLIVEARRRINVRLSS
jgi:hypothetical protein